MLKKISIILFALTAFANFSYGQKVSDEKVFNEIPREQVYIHVNSSLLFSGEKLLYKFYCNTTNENNLSEISKVGWVILVNSNKEIVFHHKLILNKGQGYSDYFIPSNLASGSYKLLGYTSWMLNAEQNYFEQDILIFNPFQKENKELISEEIVAVRANKIDLTPESNNSLELKLNKQVYTTRDEVKLSLYNNKNIVHTASISVRRLDSLNKPDRINSNNYKKFYQNIKWNFSNSFILPELRGSIISGIIKNNDSSSINFKNLALAFPGEVSQLNIVSIDTSGNFKFTLNSAPSNDEVLMQLLDNSKGDYSINLEMPPVPDLQFLNFSQTINQQYYSDNIRDKSVNIQIDNAYSSKKADRLYSIEEEGYFFNQELIKFNLDDYTRFPDVGQTFIEVIENGRIVKNNDGGHSIMVRNKNTNGEFNLPALLVVDGVVVQNHDLLFSYTSDKIKSIGISRSKYYFGPEIFQGVVVVETKTGDFPKEFREANIKSAKILTYQKEKEYYFPNYEKEELDRIPDYRYQLFWTPEVITDSKEYSLNFYTSDLEGIFEINMEGFSEDGKSISISKTFEVRR